MSCDKTTYFFFDRHKTKRNWLVELWIKYAYLSGRDPIAGKEDNHIGGDVAKMLHINPFSTNGISHKN